MLRPEEAYALYARAWNDPERALALLEECWADDGVYADDEAPEGIVGRASLADLIATTHEALPGFRVWETSPPRLLAGRLGLTWAQEGGDPRESMAGTDVIEFAPDGRIARVTGVVAGP
ncbi:MAG TPA: nuclear transport factor 2 family protein [Candidatus Limnocylindrales bacterium]|nr:nuclear transport factor 2 family protein [Candidatus Limnocylindrales bacterium]